MSGKSWCRTHCTTTAWAGAGPKIARPGDFQPTEKRTSVRAKQQVRQARRLDSISRMLVRHGDYQQPTVHQDWNAVCRAKGFLPDFPTWCGEALPTYPTLGIVQQLAEQVRTSIRTLEAENSKASRQRWSDALNKSWKTQGNKLAHKATAKGSNPFLTMASQIHRVECHRLRARGKHRARFVLPAPQRRQYHELTLASGEPIEWDCKASGTFFSQSKEHTLIIIRKEWYYRPEDVQDQLLPPIHFQVPSKARAITAPPEQTLEKSQKNRPSAKWPLAVGPNTSITS